MIAEATELTIILKRRAAQVHRRQMAFVMVPIETIVVPTPRPEKSTDRNAKAKMQRSAHEKSGPRREVDDSGVICLHNDWQA